MNERKKILIVEDNKTSACLLKEIFEQHHYQVILAENGWEALKKAESAEVDLAIVDVMLPGINGFEVCERIHMLPGLDVLPIIILTVLGESQHKIRAIQSGAVDFMVKPFNQGKLLEKVDSYLTLTGGIKKRERFDLIIASMLEALRLRSEKAYEHACFVGYLSGNISAGLNLSGQLAEEIKTAGLLHDIGKLSLETSIEWSILSVPEGQYTQWLKHCDYGCKYMAGFNHPLVRQVILKHHTPFADLSRDEYGLAVRIVSLSNIFDNLLKKGTQGKADRQANITAAYIELERLSASDKLAQSVLEVLKDSNQ